jgi:predicted Zn finger-like uncharacterized protein
MILTCPECATRYFVDDERVGMSGRTVRCAACGSSWRAQAEEPLDLVTSAEEGAVARVAGESASFKPNEPAALSDVPAQELPKTFRAKTEQKRKVREAATAGVVWGMMCAGFALILGGAYLFRVDVVKLYPKAAGAYAMAGVPVNPTGLVFEKIAATPAPDGLAAVTVTGDVRNVVGHLASAPPIRVALLDKSGARISTQMLKLPVSALAPGKAQAFSISLPDPKAAAVDVDVVFAFDPAKPAAKAAPRPAPKPQFKPLVVQQAQMLVGGPVAPVPAPAVGAPAGPTKSQSMGLRPAIGVVSQKEVDAKPLPANDPYALSAQPRG